MPLIPAFHKVFGVCQVPEGWLQLHADEWSPVFDPAQRTAAAVVAHLRASTPAERNRVLALELAAARPRKTVLAAAGHPQTSVAAGVRDTTTTAGSVPAENPED